MVLQLAAGARERRAAATRLELRCQRLARSQARLLSRICVSLRHFFDIEGPFERGYSSQRDYAVERLGVSGSTASDWYRVGLVLERCPVLRESWENARLTYSALLALARHVPLADIPEWVPVATRAGLEDLLKQIASWQDRASSGDAQAPQDRSEGSLAPLHEVDGSEQVSVKITADTHALHRQALDVFDALGGGGAAPGVLLEWILAEVSTDLEVTCEDPDVARERVGLSPRPPRATSRQLNKPRTVPLSQQTASRPLEAPTRDRAREAALLDRRLRRLRKRRSPLQVALDLSLHQLFRQGCPQLLGYQSLEHWAREALKIEPRTLRRHLRRARAFLRSDAMRKAFEAGHLTVTSVQLLTRLERCGVPESALGPWIETARRTTAQNLERKVRWAELTYVQDYRPWASGGWAPPSDQDLVQADKRLDQVLRDIPDESSCTWETPDKLWPLHLRLEPEVVDSLAISLVSIQDTWARRFAPDQPTLSRPPIWACFRELLIQALRAYKPLLQEHGRDLKTRVRDRDRWMCGAPGCTRRAMLQNHHSIYRSRGGPDCEENLVALCYAHHKMQHSGRIEVCGQATTESALGLRWRLGALVEGFDNERFRGNTRE